MKTGYRAWTDDDMQQLRELVIEGLSDTAIAARLGRTRAAVNSRINRFGVRPRATAPTWGRSPFGNRQWWTTERTLEGIRDFAVRHKRNLPTGGEVYDVMRGTNPAWPPSRHVRRHFGTMVGAWEELGYRVSRGWSEWTQEDDDYLLENAGEMTLKRIGKNLRRSWGACKRRLYDLEAGRARDVSGHLSATQVAVEYNTSLKRVTNLINDGTLPARKVRGGHYWRIDVEDCERIKHLLVAPKRTHKATPPDKGDYMKRYGLRRLVGADGKVHTVAAIPEEKPVRFKPVQWRDAS